MSIAVVQTECNHGDIDDRCAGMCGEQTSPGRASLDAGAAVTGVVLPETSVVGMIGVGDMGGAIARSILRAGYPLLVYDVRPEAAGEFVALGARAAGGIEEVCAACDVACVVVWDEAEIRAVVSALVASPGRLHTVIVSSTVLPSAIIELHEEAGAAGLGLIDAPVSGGAEKAALGLLTVLVGGDDGPVRRCWPLLEAFGSDLFHLGPAGAGMAGKLVNNMLALGSNILQLEAMQLARAYGIGEDDATRFIAVGTGDARGIRTWGRYDRWRRGHRLFGTPGFYHEYSKDMRYAAIAAGERRVTLPLAAGIGAMIPAKMRQRDEYLDAAGWDAERSRCGICGLELSVAYHEADVHPECRDLKPRR
jgi:3-hydroxyisobutyrate dehydrogenase-like beta-hydroxyacid dehydrogenase